MGIGAIRSIFEWWRPILDLGPVPLTTDMARKTFVTFGVKYTERDQSSRLSVLFKIPAEQLMEVTHHRSPEQFQTYVVNSAWRDRIVTRHPILKLRRTRRARSRYGPADTTSLPSPAMCPTRSGA